MTTIHGMYKKTPNWLFLVYVTENGSKYFVGAYRSIQQARAIAENLDGNISILNI